eukprot:5948009-Pyramimonas_sp.AAC.1
MVLWGPPGPPGEPWEHLGPDTEMHRQDVVIFRNEAPPGGLDSFLGARVLYRMPWGPSAGPRGISIKL